MNEVDDMNTVFIAGINFDNADAHGNFPSSGVTYSIRMPAVALPATFKRPSVLKQTDSMSSFDYVVTGFIFIQDLVDHAIMSLLASNSTTNMPTVMYNMFPLPAYITDQFSVTISGILALIMTISWIYSVSMIVKGIVHEKEMRLGESMKMMGLHNWVHWLGWFLTSFIITTFSVIFMTLLLSNGQIFEKSNPFIIFIFLETYGISTIMLSFAISVFFSKAKVAASCAGLIYFLMYLPFVYFQINLGTFSVFEHVALCFSSTTAFGMGASFISLLENNENGLQWSNFYSTLDCSVISFGTTYWMIVLDILIYGSIAWYVDAVFPGQYGVPKPWNFFLNKDYWLPSKYALSCSRKSHASEHEYQPLFHESAEDDNHHILNASDVRDDSGVSIRHLTKVRVLVACPAANEWHFISHAVTFQCSDAPSSFFSFRLTNAA